MPRQLKATNKAYLIQSKGAHQGVVGGNEDYRFHALAVIHCPRYGYSGVSRVVHLGHS